MVIADKIIVRDENKTVQAFLSPTADGIKEAYVDARINGESTLEFMIPVESEKLQYITPESELEIDGKRYSLLKEDAIDFVRSDDNKLWAKVMAVEVWADLQYSFVEPSISNDPTAKPAADLAVLIVGNGSDLSGGKYRVGSAAHALYAILKGTDWSLGTVDMYGTRDLEAEKVSRLELVKRVQNLWGGLLYWDSINKKVHLRDPSKWQDYEGVSSKVQENLKHITRTQTNKIITKLYPFGYQNLDIASENGGRKYITNYRYTDKTYVGIMQNNDIYLRSELKAKAEGELEFLSRPRHLYKVNILDIRVLPEYAHEHFKLGDMVDIIDDEIVANTDTKVRVIRHKYNVFAPWKCELEIGDPEERLVEKLAAAFNNTQFVDTKFQGNGKLPGDNIKDETVTGDKVAPKTIDGDHIINGSLTINNLEDGFTANLNLLENPVFSSLASDVNGNATAIQQNAKEIRLQAGRVDKNVSEISSLKIRSDQIELKVERNQQTNDREFRSVRQEVSQIDMKANEINISVRSLERDLDNTDDIVREAFSEIRLLDREISSKVGYYDKEVGEWMVSEINQTPDRIIISADKIDLYGITSVYGGGGRTELQMTGSSMILYSRNSRVMSIGLDSIAGAEYDSIRHVFYGYVEFKNGTNLDRNDGRSRNFTPAMDMIYNPSTDRVEVMDFGKNVGEFKN